MKIGRFIEAGFIAVLLLSANALSEDSKSRFERFTDADTPLSTEGVARIEAYLRENGSSSLLMLHKGKIAYAYGDIHEKHLIHSMRKPLMSLLYGIAVKQGKIDLDEAVATLDIAEPATPFTDAEKQATLVELLKARSGIYLPAAAETVQMAAARPARGSHQPGEAYYYNNWSFNSVGTVYETRTGTSIYDAFREQLAEPLGMTAYKGKIGDFTITGGNDTGLALEGLDGFYLLEPDKSRHRAYHFRLSAHDLGLIGQMLVNGGSWNGDEIVPEDWIKRSTDCHSVINADIGGGRSLCYGMMWEIVRQDGTPTAFLHTGLGVHMLYVHPGAEIVLVHRVHTEEDGYIFPSGGAPTLIGLTFGAFKRD